MEKNNKLKSIFSIIAFLLIMGITPNLLAIPINVLGIDTTSAWNYSTVPSLTNVNFTKVSNSDFATVDLNVYDILYVGETFLDGGVNVPAQATLDALKSRKSDIANWLSAGHGILALSEPIGIGPYDWLPDAIQPNIGLMIHDNSLSIVNPSHPVMSGLTSSGISDWRTSSHGNFLDTAGLDILVTDGGTRPITLAGTYGSGKVVLTLQDPDFHNFHGYKKPDQITFVQNSIDWLSQPIPEPTTMLLFGSGLIGLTGFRRRFKK